MIPNQIYMVKKEDSRGSHIYPDLFDCKRRFERYSDTYPGTQENMVQKLITPAAAKVVISSSRLVEIK